ncbi:protein FAM47E isoform X2 [Rhinatrema bivittatum]|uniref:protein FAM47E isoform X2 n=1 Tax=Rhinatrema bivittatum TaxID=194408 RepID=UPI00112D8D04|nr:protein FAM47E isoform X2 [Rhinatrema bivittatum]
MDAASTVTGALRAPALAHSLRKRSRRDGARGPRMEGKASKGSLLERFPPVVPDPDRNPRPRFPWYKKQLLPKYLKGLNDKLYLSDALNGRRWQFLQSGIDDFRDGYPVPCDKTFVKRTMGSIPLLNNVPLDSGEVKKKSRKRFTAHQACFSKLLPLQQARRDFIAEIEYGLSEHPLALYPHLEDSVPPELFEKVVDILDPDMCVNNEEEESTEEEKKEKKEWCYPERTPIREVCLTGKDVCMITKDSSTRYSMSKESKPKNPYAWLSKKEETIIDDKLSTSRVLDENLKKVTKEFCDWIASWGGEKYNIDEATLLNLFDSGYDTKPAHCVPIHVVELNNVPAELRKLVGFSVSQIPLTVLYKKESDYSPKWEKTRYGAWYLDPQTWKKQNVREPLQDPNAEINGMNLELLKKNNEKDEQLMKLHSTAAFKMFIDKKGYRRPEFLLKFFKQNSVNPEEINSKFSTMSLQKRSRWQRSGSSSTQEGSLIT